MQKELVDSLTGRGGTVIGNNVELFLPPSFVYGCKVPLTIDSLCQVA